MPFVSKSQQRFMYAKHPEIAKEFAAKTKDFKGLPERKAAVKRALHKKKK